MAKSPVSARSTASSRVWQRSDHAPPRPASPQDPGQQRIVFDDSTLTPRSREFVDCIIAFGALGGRLCVVPETLPSVQHLPAPLVPRRQTGGSRLSRTTSLRPAARSRNLFGQAETLEARNFRPKSRFLEHLQRSAGESQCHAATSRNTPTSRNGRRNISSRATRAAAIPEKEAERRAWATVNKDDGGGKRAGGSGRGKSTGHPAAHKGGRIGGAASAARSPASRSASAKKAAATRNRNGARSTTRPGGGHD